jgi:hypothetical protein
MRVDLLVCLKSFEQRFSIPISTGASESTFSTSGYILDDFRSSLTPFMLQALLCTQDWLRWSIPIDIEENIEEFVMLRFERQRNEIIKCSLFIHFLSFYTCEVATWGGATADGHDGSTRGAPGGRPCWRLPVRRFLVLGVK